MLIRVVKDWEYPVNFFEQTPNGDGYWSSFHFTEEKVETCDYLIVLQRPPYPIKVKCREGCAWLIVQEPPVDYFDFFKRSFRYFDRVYSYYNEDTEKKNGRIHPVLPWHVLKSYKELVAINRSDLAQKKSELVWITSNKKGFHGQTLRMKFRDYLDQNNFMYHLFGRGFRIIDDKFDALFPFKYSLSIENYSTPHYWTEKLADSFLSWCLPFYWGAANLEDYFPSESFIRIDINHPERALQIIRDSIANNEWERRLSAIEIARNKVLNDYQFFPFISQLIEQDSSDKKRINLKEYSIPINPFPRTKLITNEIKYYLRRLIKLFNIS